jgi:hypothetical protein
VEAACESCPEFFVHSRLISSMSRKSLVVKTGLYQRGSANTSGTVFMVLEGILLVVALVITFKGYASR